MKKNLCPTCHSLFEPTQDAVVVCSCGWSGTKTETITEYTVLHLKVDRIYSDRNPISPMDLSKLVKNIELNGLLLPITVQPCRDVTEPPEGFDFRVVDGHRRFTAFKLLEKEEVPAIVKVGLSETQVQLIESLKSRPD